MMFDFLIKFISIKLDQIHYKKNYNDLNSTFNETFSLCNELLEERSLYSAVELLKDKIPVYTKFEKAAILMYDEGSYVK